MFDVTTDITWTRGAGVLILLLAGGFLVSWLATDVLDMARRRYIAVLAATTVALTATTVWLTHVGTADFFGHNLAWGFVGAAITGGLVGFGIRKVPATLPRAGHELHEAEAWEGVVYGISEGTLLSALPAFVAWQAAVDAGWATAAAWGAALVASALLIAVHHLGYWDYRGPLVFEAVGGCLVLTVGFLATGSIVAPVLGHVVMHIAGVTKGVELPPHPHRVAGSLGR